MLRFPHIADGGSASGNWRTSFVIGNRSTSPATATISFYNDTGAALNLSVGGVQQSKIAVVVPALGVAEVHTEAAHHSGQDGRWCNRIKTSREPRSSAF